jgi:hypothetical protein
MIFPSSSYFWHYLPIPLRLDMQKANWTLFDGLPTWNDQLPLSSKGAATTAQNILLRALRMM